jgi:hypothetical protein
LRYSKLFRAFKHPSISRWDISKTGCSYKTQFYGVLYGTSKLHRQKEDDGHTFILTLLAALKRKYVNLRF